MIMYCFGTWAIYLDQSVKEFAIKSYNQVDCEKFLSQNVKDVFSQKANGN